MTFYWINILKILLLSYILNILYILNMHIKFHVNQILYVKRFDPETNPTRITIYTLTYTSI